MNMFYDTHSVQLMHIIYSVIQLSRIRTFKKMGFKRFPKTINGSAQPNIQGEKIPLLGADNAEGTITIGYHVGSGNLKQLFRR